MYVSIDSDIDDQTSRSQTTVQKVKVRKWLTFKKKMKVIDEVKRAKPVMDVAAEFGVVLCYYQPPARLMLYTTGMYVITTNTLNCAMLRQGL